jgi:hypothetical protein
MYCQRCKKRTQADQCSPTGGEANLCVACAIEANREHVQLAIEEGRLPKVARHYKGWKEPHDPCSPAYPPVSKEYMAFVKSVLADRAAKAQAAQEDEDNKRRERAAHVRIPSPIAPKPVTPQLPPPCTVPEPVQAPAPTAPPIITAPPTITAPRPVSAPLRAMQKPLTRYVIPPQYRHLPIGKLWTIGRSA